MTPLTRKAFKTKIIFKKGVIMKINKIIIIISLVLILAIPMTAKKRRSPHSIDELTNPESPSYVPYPYPKNRKEVIYDLIYGIKKTSIPHEGSFVAGRIPESEKILLNLLEANSIYEVGKIFRMKNLSSGNAHDFSWFIFIADQSGENVYRVYLNANGLLGGGGPIKPEHRAGFNKSKKGVLTILSESIDIPVKDLKTKRIDRMAFGAGSIGDKFSPTWEIEMKDGKKYYYSIMKDMIYAIDEKRERKLDKNGRHGPWLHLVNYGVEEFVFDDLEDKIIILKKIKRKK
jgi:hypothetical protein